MNESAHVTSVEAVANFAAALRCFEDEASRGLLAIDQQANRALQWLEHEAPAYWREQIRRCFDDISRARAALETCRMRKVAGHKPACIEEEKAYRKAKQRLADAEEKAKLVQRWAIRLRREMDEFRGRIGNFRRCLEGDVPRAIALLERTLTSLEAYLGRPLNEPERDPDQSADAADTETGKA